MADSVLRIGIVGAGTAGGRHAAALRKLPGISIIAVAEPDERRRTQFAADLGAAPFESTNDTFWNAIDAVVICAPHALLAAIALGALNRGKPTLIEKPLALSLADIDGIQRVADRTGLPVMVGFVHRHRADAIAARHAIDSGVLGEPTFAVEHLISGGGPTPSWVWSKSLAGGGVTLYNGVHGIDRLRWLLNREVTHVYAQTAARSRPTDVEDIAVATILFEGGVSASFVQHIAPYHLPPGWRSELYGTQGAVLFGADGLLTITAQHTTTAMKAERDDRFLTQGVEFVSAIREGRSPSVTIADGRAALQIALAIYRSAETGTIVALSDIVA